MGRRGTPRKLGVPGEERPKVMYQLADAESYENQRILVVGGGDSAVEAALGLAGRRGNRVTLSYRREKLVRIKRKNESRIAGMLASRRIEGAFNTDVQEIGSDLRPAEDARRNPRAAQRLRLRLRRRRPALRAAAADGHPVRRRSGRRRGPRRYSAARSNSRLAELRQ